RVSARPTGCCPQSVRDPATPCPIPWSGSKGDRFLGSPNTPHRPAGDGRIRPTTARGMVARRESVEVARERAGFGPRTKVVADVPPHEHLGVWNLIDRKVAQAAEAIELRSAFGVPFVERALLRAACFRHAVDAPSVAILPPAPDAPVLESHACEVKATDEL